MRIQERVGQPSIEQLFAGARFGIDGIDFSLANFPAAGDPSPTDMYDLDTGDLTVTP